LRPPGPAGAAWFFARLARQAQISRLACLPGWRRFPGRPDCLAGLTAWLLRNFTSRFDDGAPAFAGIVFTAAVVASASADDGAPLPTPHSPDRCRHLLILLTPPCWRSPTPLIAGQIAITSTRVGHKY